VTVEASHKEERKEVRRENNRSGELCIVIQEEGTTSVCHKRKGQFKSFGAAGITYLPR